MGAVKIFLRDVLRGTLPSYEKDPGQPAYFIAANGDEIIRIRGTRKIVVPITQMRQDEKRASEAASVLLQSAVAGIKPIRAYSYAEAVYAMAETLQKRKLRLTNVLADHKWRAGLPAGVRSMVAATMPEQFALGLASPETLGMMPVSEDGRIGLMVYNIEGIVPVEILPN